MTISDNPWLSLTEPPLEDQPQSLTPTVSDPRWLGERWLGDPHPARLAARRSPAQKLGMAAATGAVAVASVLGAGALNSGATASTTGGGFGAGGQNGGFGGGGARPTPPGATLTAGGNAPPNAGATRPS
jgi:hypothetical protein